MGWRGNVDMDRDRRLGRRPAGRRDQQGIQLIVLRSRPEALDPELLRQFDAYQ